MTVGEARLIRYLKLGKVRHSWKRIADIYYEESHNLFGNRLDGMDLCREAAKRLGEHYMDWED